MAVRPVPTDSNGWKLADRGTLVGSDKRTYVDGAAAKALEFPVDVKEVMIYVDSGALVVRGIEPIGKAYLDAAAVTDNGDGTVTIAAAAHGFPQDGSVYVTIEGTTYYDGYWPTDAATDANNITLTPTATHIHPTAAAVVDAGAGKVEMACSNIFNDGDTVVIAGTTNYNGTYTLNAASTTAKINITAAYVAETLDGTETITGFPTETLAATDYAVSYRDITLAAGSELILPTVTAANTPICYLSASTGANCTISIVCWR